MKKQAIALIVSIFVVGQMAGFLVVKAEVSGNNNQTSEVRVSDVISADSVKTEDLGVKTPRLLPISPFYFVKDIGRDIQKFFTFDQVKKVELEVKFADEKLAETKVLADTRPDKQEALKRALELYRIQMNELKIQLEDLSFKSQNPNVQKLLEKVTDRAIKHGKLFDELVSNTKLTESVKNEIKATQDSYLDVVSVLPKKFDIANEFSARLERVVGTQIQNGTEFEPIRILETIDRLEPKLSEETNAQIAPLREDLLSQSKVVIGATSAPIEVGKILDALPGNKETRAKIMGEIQEFSVDSGAGFNSQLEAVAEAFNNGIKQDITKEKAASAIKEAEARIGELRRALGISVNVTPVMDTKGKYVIGQSSSNMSLLQGTPIPNNPGGGISIATGTPVLPIGSGLVPPVIGQYGNRDKALEFFKKAGEELTLAKQAFNEGKFGEAFGQAIAAEAHARSGLRALANSEDTNSLREVIRNLTNGLNKIKEKIKNLGWTSENKPEVFAMVSQAENLLKQAENLLGNKKPEVLDILRQIKEILYKLESAINGVKPVPPTATNTFSGALTAVTPNIYQWGTHALKTNGGKVFQVKAFNDSVLADLKKYENKQVTVYGKANYYDIEGGFYGIIAEKISLSEVPISLFQVLSPKEGEKWEVGKAYQIQWSATAAKTVNIYLDTGIVCVKAPCPSRITIAENVSAQNRSYSWTIPADFGVYPSAQIVVEYVSNSAKSARFAIVGEGASVEPMPIALLRVLSPKEGDKLEVGKNYQITWNPDGIPLSINKINIYLDTGIRCITTPCPSQITIAENISAKNGSYLWKIPLNFGIYSRAQIILEDARSGYFSIVAQ